jgi:hypothetical protein
MNIIMRARCAIFGHERSERRAYDDGKMVRSYCRHCEVRMVRTENGWQVAA